MCEKRNNNHTRLLFEDIIMVNSIEKTATSFGNDSCFLKCRSDIWDRKILLCPVLLFFWLMRRDYQMKQTSINPHKTATGKMPPSVVVIRTKCFRFSFLHKFSQEYLRQPPSAHLIAGKLARVFLSKAFQCSLPFGTMSCFKFVLVGQKRTAQSRRSDSGHERWNLNF